MNEKHQKLGGETPDEDKLMELIRTYDVNGDG